eukprot:TRINITY_DN33342_c0_g1_i1.p1 TRINITY_DN33342_c0_g1~~TRINITY_DN33342_c0_g1_i1.p1  ORF type:complete len:1172 (+),score=270.83 TRINITY_DN33342_c0_g1_i1:89-3604(+)
MDRYPLRVTIPRSETGRSTFGLRTHTEYIIEVDDCGKVYTRSRRFQNFVWLHAELRRKQLACALPELPAKKLMGNMEAAFVERRRQNLEDYLQALLKLPAVIQDDMVWAFLDADEATAVVPRFLCRPASHAAADKCLAQLKRAVADREVEIFRLCNSVVLEELTNFALAEGSEAAVSAAPQPQAQQALQARLGNRVRLCGILLRIINYERARQLLVKSGVFGALLALLWRATEDEVAAAPTQRYPTNNLHRSACLAVTDCLKRLIQESQGEALLYFCQQDNALDALRKLASAEVVSLHPVAAWLLWHGLRCRGVITALAGSCTRGLTLLGRLLTSPDLTSRVLAALCVGSFVRQDGALDEDSQEHCLRALASIPADLDASEAAFMSRLAAASLTSMAPSDAEAAEPPAALSTPESRRRASPSLMHSSEVAKGPEPIDKKEDASATSRGESEATRDISLVRLLSDLCSPKELSRLQLLLGPCGVQEFEDGSCGYCNIDTVTAAVVSILDHFVQHCLDAEPTKLRDLQPLMPQLQLLVEGESDDGSQMVAGGAGGAAAGEPPAPQVSREEVRVRAARLLMRLPTEGPGREPPQLPAFGPRAHILKVLVHHSELCQTSAFERLCVASEHCKHVSVNVGAGGLREEPCMSRDSVQDFMYRLQQLTGLRSALGHEVGSSQSAVEAMIASLEQRRMKHGVLGKDIEEACEKLIEQADALNRSSDVHAELATSEEHNRAVSTQVELLQTRFREAEALARDLQVRCREGEVRVNELDGREAELAEICHNAPARLEQLQARFDETSRRRATLAKQTSEVLAELDRNERRIVLLREAEHETEAALKTVEGVGKELTVMKKTINSELIMTDAEVAKLRALEQKMTPSRPSRLRRLGSSSGSGEALMSTEMDRGGESAASSAREAWPPAAVAPDMPPWDDAGAEQEFHDSPHFRALKRLRDERERMWTEEKKWLKEAAERSEAAAAKVLAQHKELEQSEQQAIEEEEQLRREITVVNDFEGHALRHSDARAAAADARAGHQMSAQEAAEAVGAQRLAQARLEQATSEAAEVAERLAAARAAAEGEEEQSLKVRQMLQKLFLELEGRCREHLQDWRGVVQEEQRLCLLQERVNERLREEFHGRQALRSEVNRLVQLLTELDRQLDVPGALSGAFHEAGAVCEAT